MFFELGRLAELDKYVICASPLTVVCERPKDILGRPLQIMIVKVEEMFRPHAETANYFKREW